MKIPQYHKGVISKFPAGEWVKPTNRNCNDFDVFAQLFEWGLVERKIEEHYKGKRLVGTTHYFRYNKNKS